MCVCGRVMYTLIVVVLSRYIPGTDNGSIAADTWCDLCTVIGSHDQLGGCKLGLKQIQDSVKVLTSNYIEKRTSSGSTVYTLLINGYVPLIGKFIRQLCLALVESWADAIAMDTIKHKEGKSNFLQKKNYTQRSKHCIHSIDHIKGFNK